MIRQVVAYRRLKTKRKFETFTSKVGTVTYESFKVPMK